MPLKKPTKIGEGNKKRLKQGLPPLAVPEDSGGEDLAEPEQAKKMEEKAVEESIPPNALKVEESKEVTVKDEKILMEFSFRSFRNRVLVDFLQQDIASFSNTEVVRNRVVHEGCAKILGDYFTMQ